MAILDPDRDLTANFSVGEFQRVSNRPLTDADLPALAFWTERFLQPIRRAWGPIRITSFVRTGDVGRAHESGGAVDFVPTAPIDGVFAWVATYMPDVFGRLIYERNHIHVARRGPEPWAGYGVVLREPVEGIYELASFPGITSDTGSLATWLVVLALLLAVVRSVWKE